MFKKKDTSSQRLVELQNAEIERLKLEIERVKRENAELRVTNDKLKQSLENAERSTKPTTQPAPRGLRSTNVQSQAASSDTADTDSELQRQLNSAIQQLSETRKQLLNVKDQLTVAMQVTAATQNRQLVQEGVLENLPKTDSVYEKLRFDPTQEHVYAKLQTHAGCVSVFCH